MAFHDIRFPANLSFGATGGPERRTDIVTLTNGYEERNTPWRHSRRRFDAGVGMRSLDDIAQLTAFFEAREGQLHGFRWKDWGDFKSCVPSKKPEPLDQKIAVGDETTKVVPLVKLYVSGAHEYVRPITKPVAGSVRIAIGGDEVQEGIDFALDVATGLVTFDRAPDIGAIVTAGYEFDVPVRFDTDRIETSVSSFQAGQAPSVPVVEVRI
ncbi:phage distal tail protein, Rcc01695 family [Loktanella sp. DJP18]|uniref:phage distal tail protein, Rcc01695 family n=1 Tax=Loktanella sp. DJP18 TaxID=3409788 RepID=UPI003BB71825